MTASDGTQSITNLLLPTANQINFTIGIIKITIVLITSINN